MLYQLSYTPRPRPALSQPARRFKRFRADAGPIRDQDGRGGKRSAKWSRRDCAIASLL